MLTQDHLIKHGGTNFTNPWGTKFIDINKCKRSRLRFYDCGGGTLNVFLVDNSLTRTIKDKEGYQQSAQLCLINTLKELKLLLSIYDNPKYREKPNQDE